MKLSIIVPAYNEEKTIHLILDKIRDVKMINDIEKEILIVNDFSKDNTETAIHDYMKKNPEVTISYHKHEFNQ